MVSLLLRGTTFLHYKEALSVYKTAHCYFREQFLENAENASDTENETK